MADETTTEIGEQNDSNISLDAVSDIPVQVSVVLGKPPCKSTSYSSWGAAR